MGKAVGLTGLVMALMYLLLVCLAVYGWVVNIVTLVRHVGPFALIEVIRIIGIVVPPVGAVMGYVG